jgi:hypothetical protein
VEGLGLDFLGDGLTFLDGGGGVESFGNKLDAAFGVFGEVEVAEFDLGVFELGGIAQQKMV